MNVILLLSDEKSNKMRLKIELPFFPHFNELQKDFDKLNAVPS